MSKDKSECVECLGDRYIEWENDQGALVREPCPRCNRDGHEYDEWETNK